ncbi:MAG TPA: peptide-methionine (S)-S-oxide reductase MsrA [Ligilactobacillus acidipiscis]|uniref:Peptide methionine sulfoxide reductase MsrA n=1 Tax=Ligilactobacillus acidipiscis TaxID=89059 RepID=A0A921F6X1_9LACO|nr:peptide-methionine (S)-S-oxide reductase MsrA [Ligilactobacillus acidipiscis]
MNKTETLQNLQALLNNTATHEWEKQLLEQTRKKIQAGQEIKTSLEQLEFNLRPLALRNNLTPAVADFYLQLKGDPAGKMRFDYSIHYQKDPAFQERAIFSGGCFWCLVEPFNTKEGVKSVISGYTGGHLQHPSYEQVKTHKTGHVEAVEIIFDSRKINYQTILATYWRMIDPTDAEGQFDDRGNNYRPAIFYTTPEQKQIAEKSKNELQSSNKYAKPIVVPIEPAKTFWPAENYHQEFYKKFKTRYRHLERTRKQVLFLQHLHARIRTLFKKSTKSR